MDKPLSQVFEECADRLERGWAQQGKKPFDWTRFGDRAYASCAYNTIAKVMNTCDIERSAAAARLTAAIGGEDIDDIFRWNDAPERTQAEVVAMFRALAATERAREGRLLPVLVPA